MDQYWTFEARLASYQKNSKKRGSTAGGRGKALNWPHRQIAPESLAKAGFYFDPYPESPDNCVCFLCAKGLDGWETGDDPLEEHLKHASDCGWAIAAAIEADNEEYSKQDPSLPRMVAAREATFGGKWPHEGRKGWKCKTKQLVEAGWHYTPTDESDDMATCAYCQLALDGWEPSDKPYDEHINRSPNCAFFDLLKHFGVSKKKTRAKAARGSKTLRLSTQSVTTNASDAATIADVTAEPEDSVLTIASTAAQGGKKTTGKRKKATANNAKTSKAKPSKAKALEQEETPDSERGRDLIREGPETHHVAVKPSRGQKRTSDAMDDSLVFLREGPAPKRQASSSRENSRADGSTIIPEDVELVATSSKTSRERSSSVKSNGKPSTLTASTASLRAPTENLPDDEEIERQLEADLERFATDDEITHDSESERSTARVKNAKSQPAKATSQHFAMFDPAEVDAADDIIDEELRTLEAEMKIEESEQELHVPKKGRKVGNGVRKASQQTKTKKKAVSSPPEPQLVAESDIGQPLLHDEEHEASIGSTDTVVKRKASAQSSSATTLCAAAPPANAIAVPNSEDAPTKRGPAAETAPTSSQPSTAPVQSKHQAKSAVPEIHEDVGDDPLSTSKLRHSPQPRSSPSPVVSRPTMAAEPPSTPPKAIVSPTPSARQPALSPSQSPQTSDAENQPPSSVPATSARAKRVVLVPVASTPLQNSPSRRNKLGAGLLSQAPWTMIDLDAVLGSPPAMADQENAVNRILKQGKEMSSPEKRMTVEEWIYFNAGEAEKKLKHECETMVTRFEKEGTRAMNVLEGIPLE